ncbi:MAG: YceI family protein, partial [Halobacteriovoraceae bacterium]|nr:YceI family protein [Halobacteriovoraceae bacterium]
VWTGKKITGDSHTGTVGVKSGKLEMKDGKLAGGMIVIDMTKITTTDLSGKWAKKLVGHLSTGDFFEVEKHGEAKFEAKKVTAAGKGKYKVNGELTIKGISKPISVELVEKKGAFSGKLNFDRTKFDVKYNSGSFFKDLGDKLILDDVELDITLATK